MEKCCTVCKVIKPLKDFYYRHSEKRHYSACIQCECTKKRKHKIRKRAKQIMWPDHWGKATNRDRYYRRVYGITVQDYDRMFCEQDGKCKLCGTTDGGDKIKKYFSVDHCHDTGKIRGLLCMNCNRDLAVYEKWRDRIELLDRYIIGEVAEWTIAPVLKTGGEKSPVGSNPTFSASGI